MKQQATNAVTRPVQDNQLAPYGNGGAVGKCNNYGIVSNINQSTISGCNNVIYNIGISSASVDLLLRIIQQQGETIAKQTETIRELHTKYLSLLVENKQRTQ